MPLNTYTTFSLSHSSSDGIYNNMDEPGRHCTKWNKPVSEGLILNDSVYEGSKVVKLTEAENGMVVARAGGGGRELFCG